MMRRFFAWLRAQDRNEKAYWLGLLMMFLGLTWYASIFVALTVTGGVMIVESVITSYLAAWINSRPGEERP